MQQARDTNTNLGFAGGYAGANSYQPNLMAPSQPPPQRYGKLTLHVVQYVTVL